MEPGRLIRRIFNRRFTSIVYIIFEIDNVNQLVVSLRSEFNRYIASLRLNLYMKAFVNISAVFTIESVERTLF